MTEQTVLESPLSDTINVQKILDVVTTIFSALILTAIAVIISGKLISSTTQNTTQADDYFVINLVIFRIRAKGDEVMWGFAVFIFSMGQTVYWGGEPAYMFFKHNTGLDIGHWSSLCAIAGFFSVIASAIIWLAVPLLRSAPLISKEDREDQIKKLEQQQLKSEGDHNGRT